MSVLGGVALFADRTPGKIPMKSPIIAKKKNLGIVFYYPKHTMPRLRRATFSATLKTTQLKSIVFSASVPGKLRKVPLATVAGFRGFKLMEINEPQRLFSRFSFNELT